MAQRVLVALLLFPLILPFLDLLLVSAKQKNKSLPNVCHLPREEGECLAYMPKWYFNPKSGTCELFIYGGCRGNENRFDTRKQCRKICAGPDEKIYNDTVTMFEGMAASCHNMEISMETIIHKLETIGPHGTGPEPQRLENLCKFPVKVGSCATPQERWFYDWTAKKCKKFFYSGCDGNLNNFRDERLCEINCMWE